MSPKLHTTRGKTLQKDTEQLHNAFAASEALCNHYQHPDNKARKKSSQKNLDDLLSTVHHTLQHLTRMLDKHSGLEFWDRLRPSALEIDDLSAALDHHILDLTCFGSSLGLQNDREI